MRQHGIGYNFFFPSPIIIVEKYIVYAQLSSWHIYLKCEIV